MSYILVALFLTILYSSFVKASMMTTPPTKRISYLRELIKEKNLKPIVPGKTYLTDLIRVSLLDEAIQHIESMNFVNEKS